MAKQQARIWKLTYVDSNGQPGELIKANDLVWLHDSQTLEPIGQGPALDLIFSCQRLGRMYLSPDGENPWPVEVSTNIGEVIET